MKKITPEDVAVFSKKHSDFLQSIDQWFIKRTEERNIHDILCLIQVMSIFCGIAAKEIKELDSIMQDTNTGKYFFNA